MLRACREISASSGLSFCPSAVFRNGGHIPACPLLRLADEQNSCAIRLAYCLTSPYRQRRMLLALNSQCHINDMRYVCCQLCTERRLQRAFVPAPVQPNPGGISDQSSGASARVRADGTLIDAATARIEVLDGPNNAAVGLALAAVDVAIVGRRVSQNLAGSFPIAPSS
jgi:hypothetical protein